MSYSKIINAVLLLSVITMHAGKEATSQDGTLLATIGKDGKSVNVRNAQTRVFIKLLPVKGTVESIDEFIGNTKLLATVKYVGGIDPDHMQEKRVQETICLEDDSCSVQ